MNRRSFLEQSVGTVGAALTMGPAFSREGQTGPAPAEAGPPNVIWLIADQWRGQALGCNGDPNVRTPNIDNLSSLGVNLTSAVAGFPLCCPFRGSLLAGRYPHRCVPGHEYPLPEGQETIAKPFKDAGYRTAYFGKWHLQGFKEREGRTAMKVIPVNRRGGFETWAAYENNNSQYDCWIHGGEGETAFHYRLPGYETDELTNLLIRYVKEAGQKAKAGAGQPFFAVLSVQPPHNPYVAPEEFLKRYNGGQLQLRANVPAIKEVQETARRELAGYYAMIENFDWNVGRIVATLDEAGLRFNTHMLIFSDHGDMHGSHGLYRKTNPYEESIRIPFIISGETARYQGRKTGRFPVPLNHVDIAPTTLGLCGIRPPDWMVGTDYSHYRVPKTAATSDPDSAYLQCVVPTGHADSINKPYRGIVTRDGWKYVCFDGISWLMFNLNEDPFELMNLAHNSRYRKERAKLVDRLKQWVNDTGDTFNVPED
jgi:arylsulfatase A-like enzyme